jgi:diacylglycerol kinase (ATP)
MASAYVLVVNPHAGVGRAASMVRAVCARLQLDAAQAIETSLTSSFAQQLSAAILAAANPVTVISVGGDGTLSIIVNALRDPRVARLAIVPAGSGNDFGVALGIRSLDQALEAAAGSKAADVDLGTCNGRRFINCIGMGLDGEIARTAAAIRRRGLARGMSYYCAALVGLWRVRPVRAVLSISTGEMRIDDLLMLTVGNGAWYGGGYHGAPGASLDDGELDCFAFADLRGPARRLALMERVRRGTHPTHPVVTGFKTSSLRADFDREIAMHVDGELTAAAQVDIGVQRAALSVAVL